MHRAFLFYVLRLVLYKSICRAFAISNNVRPGFKHF